jgi:hypothetical protein
MRTKAASAGRALSVEWRRLATFRYALAVGIGLFSPSMGWAEPSNPLTLIDADGVRVTARLEAVVGGYAYAGTWFGLATLPPAVPFNDNLSWAEGWLEPGVDATINVAPGIQVYGGVSLGLSRTFGTDSFDITNQGDASLENAFGGVRTLNGEGQWNLDLSSGQQNYGVGTGMLIWQGAGNGFERGGLGILQRTAWTNATLAKLTFDGLSLEGFYLNPNELESNNTRTEMAGGVIQYRWSTKSRIGLSALKVLQSEQFYPLPSSTLTDFVPGFENGRDGLEALQGFAEIEGSNFGIPNAWVRGEFAVERNDDINMHAYAVYGEAGYRFTSLPFTPAISYGFATFSGDDPDTTDRYERFDPLFYGNGLDNWYFGANGSYTFLNSNTGHHRVALQAVLTQQDFIKLQYVRTFAPELFSPIQFGQATRPVLTEGGLVIVNGVADPHLADEIYGEWVHVFSPNIVGALWGSSARPGAGIRELPGIEPETWLGAGALLTFKY